MSTGAHKLNAELRTEAIRAGMLRISEYTTTPPAALSRPAIPKLGTGEASAHAPQVVIARPLATHDVADDIIALSW